MFQAVRAAASDHSLEMKLQRRAERIPRHVTGPRIGDRILVQLAREVVIISPALQLDVKSALFRERFDLLAKVVRELCEERSLPFFIALDAAIGPFQLLERVVAVLHWFSLLLANLAVGSDTEQQHSALHRTAASAERKRFRATPDEAAAY
jgi:hypothetical protein